MIKNSVLEKEDYSVVFGMGITGLSCARFLQKKSQPFCWVDSRRSPPKVEAIKKEFPDVLLYCGEFPEQLLERAEEIILSPGMSLKEPQFQSLNKKKIIGDVELFYRYVNAPIVAITGSNAKSSVTTLIAECVKAAGKCVAVGGNLGVPALDLLDDEVELYVLELSSFQLELVHNFSAKVAVFLNVCEDHLDRYDDAEEYVAAKQNIFKNAEWAIFNQDDERTFPVAAVNKQLSFSCHAPQNDESYGLEKDSNTSLLLKGGNRLGDVKHFIQRGTHNYANALAVLAVGEALGIPAEVMLKTINHFHGLPHRCQKIADVKGVSFVDDSKGTNVGATEAAITGLANNKNIILIAGGEGKGADFSALRQACQQHVKQAILIGRDAKKIAAAVDDICDCIFALDMESAVQLAQQTANTGDVVLLSPACASFDLFDSYEHRGNVFSQCVELLT